jgi:hypothetical protein
MLIKSSVLMASKLSFFVQWTSIFGPSWQYLVNPALSIVSCLWVYILHEQNDRRAMHMITRFCNAHSFDHPRLYKFKVECPWVDWRPKLLAFSSQVTWRAMRQTQTITLKVGGRTSGLHFTSAVTPTAHNSRGLLGTSQSSATTTHLPKQSVLVPGEEQLHSD